MPISGRATRPPDWRPVELTIVVHDEVRPWRYPPRVELQYGEWLRADALAGTLEPRPASPDAAILLTVVRDAGQSLLGPPATEILDSVPSADVRRAIREETAPTLEDLETDTRNVLLTLARMWATVATGSILSKDAAASWAIGRLPLAHRPMLERARAAYRGELSDSAYDPHAVRALAAALNGELRRVS
jgi:streptomycin 3"-adenylyltransferase